MSEKLVLKKKKISKRGLSFYILIPKAFIENKILVINGVYKITIEEDEE